MLLIKGTTFSSDHKANLPAGINRNQVLDRKLILKHIWGNDNFFSGRSMDVFITKLRNYFKQDPSVEIANFRGIGYKLVY